MEGGGGVDGARSQSAKGRSVFTQCSMRSFDGVRASLVRDVWITSTGTSLDVWLVKIAGNRDITSFCRDYSFPEISSTFFKFTRSGK